jgi:hypothetical protein
MRDVVKSILIKARRKVKIMLLFESREVLKGEIRNEKNKGNPRVVLSFGIKLFRRLERNLCTLGQKKTPPGQKREKKIDT